MSRNFMTRKSTLLAIALGLSTLGSTIMPAAAMSGRIFFGASPIAIQHFGGGIPSRLMGNLNGPVYLPGMPSVAARIVGNVNSPVAQMPMQKPTGSPIGSKIVGNVNTPATQAPVQKPDTSPSGTKIIGALNDKPAQLPLPTPPQPVAQAPAAAAPNTAAAEPCNCLTKQYLDDGSVLFRDICTREAAMATQAELQAQSQAAAR